MELLERDSLLDELWRYWDDARHGHGRFVFIGGEAGAGKTSLVRAFIEQTGSDARLMMGMCDPVSTPRPLGPLIDMVTGTGGELERLVATKGGRDQLLPGVLAELGKGQLLILVEDVHWADEATLDLLRYLGRRVDTAPAMILATYRDDETGPDHLLRRVLGDLATSACVRRLNVEPLTELGVQMLAGDAIPDHHHLYLMTGGNPFYVTEILSAGGEGLPGTVRDAVLARVGRLSPAARDVLAAAAVIGAVIEPWLLAEVARDALPVDECIANGVLRVTNGGQYAFRHELGREAIAGAIPAEQRRALHRAVLDALGGRPDAERYLDRLAHHAEGAGDAEGVMRYAPAAANNARALNAHREAAAQFRRAIRFAGGLADVDRALLFEDLARECLAISSMDEGIWARGEAIHVWRTLGHRLREAENLSQLAGLLVLSGRNADAEAASASAIELASDFPEERFHAQIYGGQAFLRMLNRDTGEAVSWGDRAIAVAERFDDLPTLIGAENAVGSALLVSGQIEAGHARLERSLALAAEAGMETHVATALGNLGSGAGEVHQFRMAREYLERGIAYCAERDLDMSKWYCTAWLSLCQLHLGDWMAAAETAIPVMRQPNAPQVSKIMALLALGRLRARRGDPDVWEALDEALELAAPTGTLQRLGPVHAARAEAAWLAGDRDRTVAEARAVYDLALEHHHPWFVGELAYWQWKAGAMTSPPAEAAAPYSHQMTGDWEAAATAWDELGCPFEAARAREESGDEEALRERRCEPSNVLMRGRQRR
ncbi:AAA family ATPase [soil metagenome]